jgi:hypothetical protein
MDLDDDIDRLYDGEREAFVPKRDELAKRLRKDGDREAAERVKGLRKPTVAAWAVDRLARDEAKDVQRLVDSVDTLRDAQEAALGGDATRLRDASAEHRDVLDKLVGAAERALGEEGTPTVDKVRETLQAASVDEAAREDLLRGRLTKEMTGGTFDPFSSMGDVELPERAPRKAKKAAAAKPAGRAAKGADRVTDRVKETRAEKPPPAPAKPARSLRELRKARADLTGATKRAASAERRLERAQAAFAQAEEKRDEARSALEDALSERDGLEATVRRLERED